MAELKDNGPGPYVVDIEELTLENDTFRTAVWTTKRTSSCGLSRDADSFRWAQPKTKAPSKLKSGTTGPCWFPLVSGTTSPTLVTNR